MKAKDYNRDWSTLFSLSSESESGLVWNCPRYFRGSPNFSRVGKPVGSIAKGKKNSYWSVGLGGDGSYLIHRIIWVMLKGSVESKNDIDHIDGDGLNNKINNLRCVSKTINSRNSRKRSDNKTGKNGVSQTTTKTGGGHQANVIDIDGKRHSKFFSDTKYGFEESFNLAVKWYDSKIKEIGYAGYSSRHGK